MLYESTRGHCEPLTFQQALLTGQASDGGLLMPHSIPDIRDRIDAWRSLGYVELCEEVVALFVKDIDRKTLRDLIRNSYATFDHREVVELVPVENRHVLELFHGPTLAFKDVALQLVGNLFDYVLQNQGGNLNILGATSGDTGSAAIAGVRGRRNIQIFVMYPHGRISPLQELQMTTVDDPNVHCLALKGSFD
ncbi:MAG: threonine synthase, partial [Gammaproteobacteria bacterium]|nr:threonine synthase [Gammaproteobacteria bacterium]